VKNNLLVTGGFHGEIICKFLDRRGISYCCKSTNDDNGITNSLEIYEKPSGSLHFLASNNDCGVRDFDMEKFQLCNNFRFAWPVNVKPSPNSLIVYFSVDYVAHLLDFHFPSQILVFKSMLFFFSVKECLPFSMWLENYYLILPPV
jgi:hypothetical protein